MKVIKGDLIRLAKQGEFDIIIHGCNCFNNMGAGIAQQIKRELHEAYTVDQLTRKGDKNKLGTITVAKCTNNTGDSLYVINAYTQYEYGGNKVNANYRAIRECFAEIKKQFSGMRIGIPKIGAGKAKGDWKVISQIITEELSGEDVTLVIWQ